MSEGAIEINVLRVGSIRICVSLMQGLLLYALFESFTRHIWPGVDPVAYTALAASLIFAPLVAIGDLTALRRFMLIGWTVAAAMIAAVLAGYESWRSLGSPQTLYGANNGLTFMSPLFALIAAVLFIGNHLLEASEIDRRIVAAYPNYFEPAWKHGVQIVLAVLFTSAFWGLLFLGAALFTLIHISLLSNVIKEPSFYWPATTVAFAAAVHLTDVRVGLVRGVRTVALTLLSWLTPLLALLAGGFVLMLPFTGLDPLWKTRAAATILLSAASWLVVLINAAYQDGVEPPTVLLRWAVRAASVILVPLTTLASIGVVLRVQQYGLTPERIIAAAWALIGVCYALGYAFAAMRPSSWMKTLEPTNVLTAWVILIIVAALFTPIADPARLSVAEQVHRLNAGQIKPNAFDYAFLRFRAARYGREALKRMAAQKGTAIDLDIANRAATALKRQNPWETAMAKPAVLAANLIVYPKGHALPEGFTTQDWTGASTFNPCFQGTQICDAYLVDLEGNGKPEVIINQFGALTAYHRAQDGRWHEYGSFDANNCDNILKAMRSGDLKTVPAEPHVDLEVAGQKLIFKPASDPIRCQSLEKKPIPVGEKP